MNKKSVSLLIVVLTLIHSVRGSISPKNIDKKHMALGLGGTFVGSVAFHTAAKKLWGPNYPSFFYGMLRHPSRVGAFAPCSHYTARALTKYIKAPAKSKKHINVLEVGGGSGVITEEIIHACKQSGASFHIDCIEIDPHYCKLLRKKFPDEYITIHEADVRTWQPDKKYDFIISTIPLMQFVFTEQDVQIILDNYKSWSQGDAVMSYITHVFIPKVAFLFLHGEKKEAYVKKMQKINTFQSNYLFDTEIVWLNWAPLHVYHLHISP